MRVQVREGKAQNERLERQKSWISNGSLDHLQFGIRLHMFRCTNSPRFGLRENRREREREDVSLKRARVM